MVAVETVAATLAAKEIVCCGPISILAPVLSCTVIGLIVIVVAVAVVACVVAYIAIKHMEKKEKK